MCLRYIVTHTLNHTLSGLFISLYVFNSPHSEIKFIKKTVFVIKFGFENQ